MAEKAKLPRGLKILAEYIKRDFIMLIKQDLLGTLKKIQHM